MSTYPLPVDGDVVYNVSPDLFLAENPERDDYIPLYVQTVPVLPEQTQDEFLSEGFGVERAIRNLILSHLKRRRHPAMNRLHERTFTKYSVCEARQRRSIDVAIDPDPGVLTVALIERLQSEVLDQHRLWRIRFGTDESPETHVLVYPDAVYVGTYPPTGDWRVCLEAWKEQMRAALYRKIEHAWRRLRWLELEVPKCLKKLHASDSPFVIAAIFECDDRSAPYGRPVWLLCRGEQNMYVVDDSVTGERMAGTTGYPVDRKGRIGIEGADWNHRFGLDISYIPARSEESLVVRRLTTGTYKEWDSEWPLLIDDSRFVSDAELEARIQQDP